MVAASKLPFLNIITDVLLMHVPGKIRMTSHNQIIVSFQTWCTQIDNMPGPTVCIISHDVHTERCRYWTYHVLSQNNTHCETTDTWIYSVSQSHIVRQQIVTNDISFHARVGRFSPFLYLRSVAIAVILFWLRLVVLVSPCFLGSRIPRDYCFPRAPLFLCSERKSS